MSMLKTIGTVFIGIGMAGVAISAVSKIVKMSQEKLNHASSEAVPMDSGVEKVIIARPKPAQIRHFNELMKQVEMHDDRLKRSATKQLSTVRKRTKVIIHK